MTDPSTVLEKTHIERGDLIKIVSPLRKQEDYYLIIDIETVDHNTVNWKALKDEQLLRFIEWIQMVVRV